MRIMFMGTPDIAAESLKALINNNMKPVCAVTQPDKPRGRGYKLMPPEVKVAAEENGIPVYQPETLKNGELQPILEEYKPDIIAVVAYGKLLPEYVLNFPKYGCVNMHASLLPKYRGAAPVQWAVINGDEYSGVTTMMMEKGLDTGAMLLSERVKIGEYETSEQLFERISALGAEVLCRTIQNIETIKPIPQRDEDHTYAPMLTKEMGKIDWNKDMNTISKLICGMNSWPLAYAEYNGENVKIIEAYKCGEAVKGKPGEVLEHVKGKGLLIKCADGGLWLKRIQFPGGKKMDIDDYLLGHEIKKGTFFA